MFATDTDTDHFISSSVKLIINIRPEIAFDEIPEQDSTLTTQDFDFKWRCTNGDEISLYQINKDDSGWVDVGEQTNYEWISIPYSQNHTLKVRAIDTEGAISNIIESRFYCRETLKWRIFENESIEYCPAIDNYGNVVFGTQNLYAYHTDATEAWIDSRSNSPISTPPAIATDHSVFYGTSDGNTGILYKYNATNNEKWAYSDNISDGIFAGPLVYEPTASASTLVYFTDGNGTVVCLEDTGGGYNKLWGINTFGFINNMCIDSTGEVKTLYLGDEQGNIIKISNIETTTPSSSVIYTHSESYPITAGPVVDSTHVYFGCTNSAGNDSDLLAINKLDGSIFWERKSISSASFVADPVIAPPFCLIGDTANMLYAIQLVDGANVLDPVPILPEGEIHATLALSELFNLYLVSMNGCLYSINLLTQQQNWSYDFGYQKGVEGKTDLTIGNDGNVYVGTNKGLYCFIGDGTSMNSTASYPCYRYNAQNTGVFE